MYIDAIHFIWRIDETRVVSWIYKKKKKNFDFIYSKNLSYWFLKLSSRIKKKNMERFGI